MKIIYVANIRFPTEKAHGIQIMKMCDAFTRAGHEVELVVPSRYTNISGDPFEYYSIKSRFPIRKLFTLDWVRFGRVGFWAETLIFSLSAFLYTLFNRSDVVFGRDEIPLLFIASHSRVAWETHTGSYNLFTKMLIRMGAKIVAITQGLKDFYIRKGVDARRIIVAPDSVDAEQFDIDISKGEARQKVGLPADKRIVLYTGHLYDWKGAHVLAQAAKLLPPSTLAAFVGGTEKDIESFKEQFGIVPNVLILGKKPYSEMPLYMKAADLLTLPNSPVNDISSLYTSPMKLFEYMASGRPIIASDLPSIREVLNDKNSVLVEPDNPELLAGGIMKVLDDEDFGKSISDKSYADSKKYTWSKRAEDIVFFIKA